MTAEEMRRDLMQAPTPLDGAPIHERFGEGDPYELAARVLGKALLLLAVEQPGLLDAPARDEDADSPAIPTDRGPLDAVMDRWPGLDRWLGGVTDIQYGWAYHAARNALRADRSGR